MSEKYERLNKPRQTGLQRNMSHCSLKLHSKRINRCMKLFTNVCYLTVQRNRLRFMNMHAQRCREFHHKI